MIINNLHLLTVVMLGWPLFPEMQPVPVVTYEFARYDNKYKEF